MRKTIILATLAALFGVATIAQASDHRGTDRNDGTRVTRAAANDSRSDKHERDAGHERSRERHDESAEKRHEAREGHAEHEAAEHRDRR